MRTRYHRFTEGFDEHDLVEARKLSGGPIPYHPGMAAPYTRNFDQPDEVVELEKVRSETITLGTITVAYDVHQPGWRWSEHVKPLVGTEWCESRHVGYILRGRLGVRLADGTEFMCRPGDLIDIPPGHDGWVVDDEPLESLGWVGGTTWLSPVQTLKERVLVTLVFTDIVDSTRIAARIGDRRWAELLSSHDQAMADTVDRYRGHIAKLTGDGMVAVFDGAARAIRGAIACRQAAEGLGLTIRAAVHTGEIEQAGDEIHGIVVNESARLMAAAGPGEVLVSDVTRTFARDGRLVFEDRGELELRGVEGPFRAHAVVSA